LNIVRVVSIAASYLAHFAAQFLRASLDRGFTTVRDVGGADIGLACAIRGGLLEGAPAANALPSHRCGVKGSLAQPA